MGWYYRLGFVSSQPEKEDHDVLQELEPQVLALPRPTLNSSTILAELPHGSTL